LPAHAQLGEHQRLELRSPKIQRSERTFQETGGDVTYSLSA
jgi:hypothetical protein